jgi:hypothetical protein
MALELPVLPAAFGPMAAIRCIKMSLRQPEKMRAHLSAGSFFKSHHMPNVRIGTAYTAMNA